MRLKASQEYIDGLSHEAGKSPSSLVQRVYGQGSQQATWGHPELAIDVAGWCSVKFKLKVNRLVARYLKGELTTEESKTAAAHLPEVVQPVTGTKDTNMPLCYTWNFWQYQFFTVVNLQLFLLAIMMWSRNICGVCFLIIQPMICWASYTFSSWAPDHPKYPQTGLLTIKTATTWTLPDRI